MWHDDELFLFALTTAVSAFLLFQVQPIIAKILLPWFGGAEGVWTVCQLFFQVTLLLGYLYAHLLTQYVPRKAQAVIHVGLLLASAIALPIYPRAPAGNPASGEPTAGILGLLLLAVGMPYFLLASTAPLMQAWYARQRKGEMPYRLYALSNGASMLALLSYPVLFEPWLGIRMQAHLWSGAYGVFIMLCGIAAWQGAREQHEEDTGAIESRGSVPHSLPPERRQYLLWMLLPACASLLMLAVTNHLTKDVAAIPLLWLLPLSVYLLSFVLCFDRRRWYRRNLFLPLLAAALGAMVWGWSVEASEYMPIGRIVLVFGAGLFVSCMACHGELTRLRPDPQYLTHYYLTISAGGALGGIFVGLVAPRIFPSFYEVPLGLVACGALVLIALRLDRKTARWFHGGRAIASGLAAAALIGMAVYLGLQIRQEASGAVLMARNFYGALRVNDTSQLRTLTNGAVNHGDEFLNPEFWYWPTTYYGRNSGVALAISIRARQGPIRVGVIGLGAGTLAAYGRPGDYYRYYETNPLVPSIAREQFHYVPGCRAKLDIVMGDARLTLEREAAQNFDVLAVDAFAGDALPVHLLSLEAMRLYFSHLRPDGILAVHVSNPYLDLQPVLAEEAKALGKMVRVVDSRPFRQSEVYRSIWVLVSSEQPGPDRTEMENSSPVDATKSVGLWTDDYSNVLAILK
jgi:spermidine synthase